MTCHDREKLTLRCLDQIDGQDYDHDRYLVDVYLTDDGCTDNTVYRVNELYPSVNIIKGDGSLYWNRGMYVAWIEAGKKDYDFYLWLNDDTLVYNNAISVLLDTFYKTCERCIVVGSTCATSNKEIITYGGWNQRQLNIDVSNIHYCETFNGNIVLIHKSIYKRLGTNDPIFHHGQGDSDYGLRATKEGIRIAVCKGVLGECDTHDKLPTWCDKRVPLKERWDAYKQPNGASPKDWFIFNRRHYGIPKAILLLSTSFLHMLFPILWNNKQSFFSKDLR